MPRHPPIELIARGLVLVGPWVLLCRALKTGKPAYAYLPGGHVEPNESARASLKREFLEECGLRVKVGELAFVSESRFTTRKRVHHEIVLTFHVELPSRFARASLATPPPVVPSLEPKIRFEWARLADLKGLDVRPEVHRAYLDGLTRRGGVKGAAAREPVAFLSDID